ncbi:MAG TPA: hypothetical protein VN726_14290 [Hanamia sp.]|nr:hypothetical protein [Hanamia sp.]
MKWPLSVFHRVTLTKYLFGGLLLLASLNIRAQDTTNFKPSGKIWGYAFGDYAYKPHADSAQRGSVQYSKLAKDYNSFNFRRVYLGYDYQFSPNISSQLLLAHESSFEANPSNADVLTNNNRAVYIKAMNIRFKNVIPRATIVAGQQSTPTYATLSEAVWGYRSVEKTIADMRGISSSTDLGVGVYGRIGKSENVGYDVLVGNNNGAKLENNNFKKIYTSLYVYFFDKKLVIQGNFEHDRAALQPVHKDISTFKAFAAYKTSTTTIGVEAFQQTQTNSTSFIQGAPPIADTFYTNIKPSGISLFLTQQLTKDKLNFFARFDIYNPDTKFSNSNNYVKGYNSTKETFATIGLDFIPAKNVHIMPNIWYDQFHSKLSGVSGNLKNDYDLVGRITMYFTFNK